MDKYKLEYEIKSRGKTVDGVCKAAGISRTKYYRIMSGKADITLKEINAIVKYLGLDSPMEIFFADEVS